MTLAVGKVGGPLQSQRWACLQGLKSCPVAWRVQIRDLKVVGGEHQTPHVCQKQGDGFLGP